MSPRSVAAGALLAALAAAGGAAPQRAADAAAIETRVEALLAAMTVEEKVGQLVQYAGQGEGRGPRDEHLALLRQGRVGAFLNVTGAAAVNDVQRIAVEGTRLRIPLLVGYDVIHGFRTIFPIPLAEAASWDPALAERAATIAAREASAAGIRWTFAPMVDIARDARWGRVAEGAGEDPYLGAVLAAARVRGFQGPDLAEPERLAATAKHYVAYGAAEAGRDYNSVDVSERTLREVHMPAFKAAVDAGAATLMSAFNDLNGIPATANRFTLTDVLRGEWGFQGMVVSDWNSVGELLVHGFAQTGADAAREALLAGVDVDMEGGLFLAHLVGEVLAGRVPMARLDDAVRRVLRLKARLGLFERPYTDAARAAAVMLRPDHRQAALDSARRAIVLLRNEGGVLPLRKDLRSLALVGPLADDRKEPLGSWKAEGREQDVVTVLEGIRRKLGAQARVAHVKGCDIRGDSGEGIAAAVEAARQAEAVVLVLGEAADMSGEAASRATLDLPGRQQELLQAVHATGKPVVLVLMNGRPLPVAWAAENVPAVVEAWFLGIEAGNAIADVLFGDFNPGGKLPVTFPRTVGQVPIYYAHKKTGRPPSPDRWTSKYLDAAVTPLFPFGHGLSYTTFLYSGLHVTPAQADGTTPITVAVEVENTGQRAGDEVVQLYVQDVAASVTRPVKELKGFQRITLQPAERRHVSFSLAPAQLAFWDRQMRLATEPGAFKVWVGPSSAQGLEGGFELVR